ncbi:MAG: cytidylyltransferase domain-containing protein, partial [Woeseiaceae bacterium]
IVINLQGDEPLMPAALINQCAALLDDDTVEMATLASPLESRAEHENPNVVKVITDAENNAIYFSRAAIPYSRNEKTDELAGRTAMHHLGIYAYRCATLRKLVATAPSDLETCEQLEQLRALSIGIAIKVDVASVRPAPGVDTEQDLARVAAALA